MSRLDEVITATPGLRAAASSDASGHVLATAGEADFETACATIALCRPPLQSAVDMLALGRVDVVTFQCADQTVIARLTGDGATVHLGGATRSPDAIARGLLAREGSEPRQRRRG